MAGRLEREEGRRLRESLPFFCVLGRLLEAHSRRRNLVLQRNHTRSGLRFPSVSLLPGIFVCAFTVYPCRHSAGNASKLDDYGGTAWTWNGSFCGSGAANVLLDLMFVGKLHMGIAGSAWAQELAISSPRPPEPSFSERQGRAPVQKAVLSRQSIG